MLKKVWNVVRWLVCGVVLSFGFAMACHMDYKDHVISEMKNNGAYAAMCENHPDWNEEQMVEAYVARR